MSLHPDIQERVHGELKAFSQRREEHADLLPPYVEACLKESMRKYPVAGGASIRRVQEAEGYKLTDKITLPKDTWICVPIYSLHNSKHIWGEDANEFKPERFMPDPSIQNPFSSPAAYSGVGKTADSVCFLPFTYGVRNCPGMNLALLEIRSAIAVLMLRYSFQLADDSLKNEEKCLKTFLTMKPDQALPVLVRKR